MSDSPTELTLECLAGFCRQLDSLTEAIGSMNKRLVLQFGDVHGRLDRIEIRLGRLEAQMRGYVSEQITLANGLLNAEQTGVQAHRRIDEMEGGT